MQRETQKLDHDEESTNRMVLLIASSVTCPILQQTWHPLVNVILCSMFREGEMLIHLGHRRLPNIRKHLWGLHCLCFAVPSTTFVFGSVVSWCPGHSAVLLDRVFFASWLWAAKHFTDVSSPICSGLLGSCPFLPYWLDRNWFVSVLAVNIVAPLPRQGVPPGA